MNTGKNLFAQLTYWESLRDIDGCLSAQAGKLNHTNRPAYVRYRTDTLAADGDA